MRDGDVASIMDVLGAITGRLGIAGAGETAAIWRTWMRIVGPEIANHAEPTSLREGVLRIRTESPVWATEIGYLAEEIRGRVNAAVGSEAVREVRVWTAPGRISTRRETAPPAPQGSEAAAGDRRDPIIALERARRAWERRNKR